VRKESAKQEKLEVQGICPLDDGDQACVAHRRDGGLPQSKKAQTHGKVKREEAKKPPPLINKRERRRGEAQEPPQPNPGRTQIGPTKKP